MSGLPLRCWKSHWVEVLECDTKPHRELHKIVDEAQSNLVWLWLFSCQVSALFGQKFQKYSEDALDPHKKKGNSTWNLIWALVMKSKLKRASMICTCIIAHWNTTFFCTVMLHQAKIFWPNMSKIEPHFHWKSAVHRILSRMPCVLCTVATGSKSANHQKPCAATFSWKRMVWSDWRTTYRLLALGHRPHKPVEGTVRCRAQIKMGPDCLQHPWVGLRQPLLVGLPGQLSSYVLMEKTENIMLLLAEIRSAGTTSGHDSQRESQNHKGSHDHPVGGRDAG